MRMHRLVVPFLSLSLACASYACSGDDDGALPDEDAGSDAAHDAGKDVHTTPADASPGVDASTPDTFVPPPQDTGTPDTTVPVDTGTPDTSVPDTSTTDTGTTDTGTDAHDANVVDTGTDAHDSSTADANDGSTVIDAGTDANDGAVGIDASSLLPSVYVLRVGDGTTALSSAAAIGNIEHIRIDGTSLGTIALPTAVSGTNQPITFSGNSGSEGGLALSANGHYVSLAGYAVAAGTAGVSSATAATVNRVVARVDAAGTVDTSTVINAAFNGGSVRGAVSNDGTAFWVSGTASPTATGGVHYIALGGTTTTQVLASPANSRWANIFENQLYVSSASGTNIGVNTVGTGLPTATGQTATPLIAGLPSGGLSTYGYVALDLDSSGSVETVYVADDRAISADGGVGGGVEKWTLAGATWVQGATYTAGLATGTRGITAFVNGTVVTLVATTADSKLVTAIDDGVTPPVFVTIATSAPNTAYRGVAGAPN